MSFLKELGRRNVFRVGIAYAAAAWLLIQVADTVFPRIGLPDSAITLVIALLAFGFIPSVIFAWAFELTPDGLRREKDVDRNESITPHTGRRLDRIIIGIMAVVVTFLAIDRFASTDEGSPAPRIDEAGVARDSTASSPATVGNASVAVLPFVNMSGDANNEYFSDGLTETVLHMLAQIPELRVAARTSSFAFKGKDVGIAEIAMALNVAHVLEGSVQKAGNRVRVTAQLIRAGDGFHVWSQNYDRTLEDIFAIQDEIATDVAGILDRTLLDDGDSIPQIETSNLDAYDTYLRALEQQAIGSYGSLSLAENLFKQALGIDSNFVDAKLALAHNYLRQADTGLIEAREMRQAIKPLLSQIRDARPDDKVARAIEILSELIPYSDFDQDSLRQRIDELLLLLPHIPTETSIRGYTALILAFELDEPEAALEVLEAGIELDPLSADLYARQGNVYRDMKQFENARHAILRALELNPGNPNNYGRMSDISAEMGDFIGAFQWRLKNIEADPQDHEVAAALAKPFYEWGFPEEGDRWTNRVRALAPNSDIMQRLLIDRARARGDADELIAVAQEMIVARATMRHESFPTAVFYYRMSMSMAGRHREAYDFLVNARPEIASFDRLPEDIQGVLTQWVSIELMSGFASQEVRKAAWESFAENLRADSSKWLDEPVDAAVDFLFMGDLESAIEEARKDLAQPLATWPIRGEYWEDPIWEPINSDPDIAARLSELRREKLQSHALISAMLQEPEWAR